jgi:hypothetical protein
MLVDSNIETFEEIDSLTLRERAWVAATSCQVVSTTHLCVVITTLQLPFSCLSGGEPKNPYNGFFGITLFCKSACVSAENHNTPPNFLQLFRMLYSRRLRING